MVPCVFARADLVDPSPARAAELRQKANVETWDDGGEVSNFVYRHPSELFPAAIVKRGGAVRELAVRLRGDVADFVVDSDGGSPRTLRDYVDREPLDGLLVVHRGVIVFERYPRMRPDDRHVSFSVTKAFVGALVALLEDDGAIDLRQPLSRYLPELRGTAWQDIAVRDVADMASGIDGKESEDAYTNPAHKIFRMEAALGWQPRHADMPAAVREGDAYGYIATMGKGREPGTKFEYSSIDTLMLAQLIERVSARRLADLLSERIWSRMGAEGDGLMLVNERGIAVAHAGLALTLRDLARFGLLFTAGADPAPIPARVRARMLKEGRPALLGTDRPAWHTHASYQWDFVHEDGMYMKGGFGGQGLYIDARRDVVVVMFGTNTSVDAPAPPMPVLRMVPALFPESAVKSR